MFLNDQHQNSRTRVAQTPGEVKPGKEIGPGYISQDLFLDIPFNSIHRRNQDAINSRLVAVGKVAVPYYNPRCAAWGISTTKGTAPLKILDTLLASLEPYPT